MRHCSFVITPLGTASKEDTNSCKQLLTTTSSQFKVNMFLYGYKSTGNEPKILIQIEQNVGKILIDVSVIMWTNYMRYDV